MSVVEGAWVAWEDINHSPQGWKHHGRTEAGPYQFYLPFTCLFCECKCAVLCTNVLSIHEAGASLQFTGLSYRAVPSQVDSGYFWFAVNDRKSAYEKAGTPFSHLPAPLCAHADTPGDSDLHGHWKCDIIYDIYNILDPLASIMK